MRGTAAWDHLPTAAGRSVSSGSVTYRPRAGTVAPNCAFCHQGSYRLHADDPATLVPAGAGTRVNVQGFLRFLTRCGADPRFTADNVMAAITAIYDMPWAERLLYRYLLVPAVRSQ